MTAEYTLQHRIAGDACDAAQGEWFEKFEPCTGHLLARVAAGTGADVDRAVRAARAEFDGGHWRRLPGAARAKLLNRLADLLEHDAERFVELLAREQGRPAMEVRMMDLPMSIDTLRYFAGWADKLEGRQIPTGGFMGRPTVNYTVREAVGVAGLIVPWNAPLMIACWKLAPALAAGCTVVIKPSEDAPLAVGALVDLAVQAGFPPGVVNLVHGIGASVGAALVNHPGVDKISFTGSTEVGRTIAREAGAQFKRLTLELGGKAPQIIFDDANLEQAIAGVAMGLFVNQGQTCAAGTRVLVQRRHYDDVVGALAHAARSVRVGTPFDPATQMGALISARHADRVKTHIAVALHDGATMVAGDEPVPSQGFFVRPTVFANVDPAMRIARDEVFGPVGTIMPFDTEDEAVALANDTVYALSATLWTRDLATAHRTAARLRVGAVAVNAWSPLDARLPWGGFKESGVGRDLSQSGLDAYLEEKVVTIAM
ncbi:aldehyde dehydrogenase family protein [Burkholderia sp. AU31624]|uniref:aldehyde dehydrogenase family protein n=1 Tax=Burkholderia sp. AU31624 TaxID=2879629 RepID=UPI001CF201F2|nr:aldehyde dehydrogenase family protein [Burkholderia sp. AU31624]MCA8258400.1 aldehyde dehydrogenase family protein [Burkholderia sp. AU31624]